MHLDFLHALVAGGVILCLIQVMRHQGWTTPRPEGKRFHWDWKLFIAVFVAMSVLNLLWPQA